MSYDSCYAKEQSNELVLIGTAIEPPLLGGESYLKTQPLPWYGPPSIYRKAGLMTAYKITPTLAAFLEGSEWLESVEVVLELDFRFDPGRVEAVIEKRED